MTAATATVTGAAYALVGELASSSVAAVFASAAAVVVILAFVISYGREPTTLST